MQKIIHVDMDCFFAAIEIRDNQSLINKPVAVGGSANRRGVICTANYIARKYGVGSAISSAKAIKLCPDLILLPIDFYKYKAVAKQLSVIFSQYTSKIEPISLDEAYLDVTDNQEYSSTEKLAYEIRKSIFQILGLTASAGVAHNKFLAKIASEWHKPNGQFAIWPDKLPGIMHALPVEKINGVGKATKLKLNKLGIYTCSDIQQQSKEKMLQHFGKFGIKLISLSQGIDHRPVSTKFIRKSLSVERTFAKDMLMSWQIINALRDLQLDLARRMQPHASRIIIKQFVKVKFSNFRTTTMECVVNSFSFQHFNQLLESAVQRDDLAIRLLGIGVKFASIQDSPRQLNLPL